MFTSPTTAAQEQTFYQQHRHHDASDYGWSNQGSERSTSVSEPNDVYPGFPPQHRAQSFPAVPGRRVSAPYDMSPSFAGAHGYHAGAGYQQHMPQFSESMQYASMAWGTQPSGRMPPFSSGTPAGLSQPWYNTQLAHVREEDDGFVSQSHARHPFQPG